MKENFDIEVILSWPGIIKPYKTMFVVDPESMDTIVPYSEMFNAGFRPSGKTYYHLEPNGKEKGKILEFSYTLAVFEIEKVMTSGRVILGADDVKPVIGIEMLKAAGFEIDYNKKRVVKKKKERMPHGLMLEEHKEKNKSY